VILPEIEAMRGVEQSPDVHPEGRCFCSYLLSWINSVKPPRLLLWARYCIDVAKPICRGQNGETHHLTTVIVKAGAEMQSRSVNVSNARVKSGSASPIW
jgi:hypothetical protein